MIQKTIRDWGGVEFSTTEGAEQQTEWNDRTEYGVDGYNSIAELGANQAPIKVKTDFITVTQAVDLDDMESDISTNSGKLTYPAPDATKVGFISITQAVDLDAMETKLATIETNATIDQTDAEIRTAVEAATDSNVFTDADHTQLATNKTNADASKVKTDFITVTQAVDLDTMESDITTNNAKTGVTTELKNVSEDTTPQAGGEFDLQAHSIGGTVQTATGDGTTTIDWKLGNMFNFQFGAFNETFTFTAPTKPGTFILKLVQDSVGSRTSTWPATVKWPGGSAPTLTTTATTGTDIITFYYDGTNYFSVHTLNFS